MATNPQKARINAYIGVCERRRVFLYVYTWRWWV